MVQPEAVDQQGPVGQEGRVGALRQLCSVLPPGDLHWRGPLHPAAQHYGLSRDCNIIIWLHSKCQFSRVAQTCVREGEKKGKEMLAWNVRTARKNSIHRDFKFYGSMYPSHPCDVSLGLIEIPIIHRTFMFTKCHPGQYFTQFQPLQKSECHFYHSFFHR